MGKIAEALDQALAHRAASGEPGRATPRVLARGEGWAVQDVICTSGSFDHPFEEQHTGVCIAVVALGTFQYRTAAGRELMTPGSLLLGGPGQHFECGHEHGNGDRCVSFQYTPEFFDDLAATTSFPAARVPPIRSMSPLVARAMAALTNSTTDAPWESLAVRLASATVEATLGLERIRNEPRCAESRVARAVRRIDREPGAPLALTQLARDANLSLYHFLRTFERLTGVTPHQYVLRTRLRHAALRLATEPTRIGNVALDCGFNDLSNFNRAFRVEFGVSPSVYRSRALRRLH